MSLQPALISEKVFSVHNQCQNAVYVKSSTQPRVKPVQKNLYFTQ